jgi:sterol desaturase/sphingolipid hydroxylase (fatty acid hydroxylase superfamily)
VPLRAAAADVRREVLCSLRTVLIFGLVGAAVLFAAQRGHTRIYFDLHAHGLPWFVLSIALTIVLHDAWFYWTHRAMHCRWLFAAVHATHHRSTNPTAWAAYSFSPLEALVQAGIFPLVAWTVPIHPLAFSLFMLFQVAENVLGHCGYEIFPRWLLRSPLGVLTNTPTHHVQHHQTLAANFGLYFNVWDRLCRTNHRDYQREFERVTAGAGAGAAGGMSDAR